MQRIKKKIHIRMKLGNSLCVLFGAAAMLSPINSHGQSGTTFEITQSVIAAGGGTSTAGNFSLESTIGQSVTPASSSNGIYTVSGGFWFAPTLAPTAASVFISGRVLTPDGAGLRNARVTMTDQRGGLRTVLTASFGYFSFADVAAGEIYVFAVESKNFVYAPQALLIDEDLNGLEFTALP
jgi:hypothetical protein